MNFRTIASRAVLAFVCLPLVALGYPLTPNAQWNPGKLCTRSSPDFTEYRYKAKIPYCARNVSDGLKARLYDRYAIPKNERGQYTIDHIIPLSIGGSNEAANLWPEHKKVKATRPDLEEEVFIAVRDSKMSQKAAVRLVLDTKFTAVQPRFSDEEEYFDELELELVD